MYEKQLRCLNCRTPYELSRMFEGCPACRAPDFRANVVVEYDYEEIKEVITKKILKRREAGIVKYKEFLPITSETAVTLGEGGTPLLHCLTLGKSVEMDNLFVKDESRNPTHTFKDRSAAVGVSIAQQFGSPYIVAGGGNTSAAAAAYSAKTGIITISFEKKSESIQAILQTLTCGGKIVYLQNYEDRYDLMKRCVDSLHAHPVSSYTPSPTGDPFSEEGRKTVSYEICEQLNWNVPDIVVVPTGMGFGLFGIWQGFVDFHQVGLIDSLPRMVAVESAAGGSLTKTFETDAEKIIKVPTRNTVARHAIVPKVSYQGYRAVKDSRGTSVTVEDSEIMKAVFCLARTEGIYSSTTSAASIAAVKKLRKTGYIHSDDTLVCVITGGGLKDPDIIQGALPEFPPSIGGDWDTFTSTLKKYYHISL
jgi:threonine synthase